MFAPSWTMRFVADMNKQLTDALRQAHTTEVVVLRSRIHELEEQVKYERAKADSLYDRLLIRDAKVAPVQAVALAAATAEAKDPKKNITEELSRVFDQLASVGEAPDEQQQAEAHTFAGGGVAISGKTPPGV